VLSAATKQSTEALDERAQEVVDRLKKGIRLSVRVVCGEYLRTFRNGTYLQASDIQTSPARTRARRSRRT